MAEIRIHLGSPTTDAVYGFGKVAPIYLNNGFKPIPVLGKRPLPKGATGYKGSVTPDKVADWVKKFPDASTGIVAEGFITVDVDHHDEKLGAEQLENLMELFGPLPLTVSSTARGKASLSRQYFYRVDEDIPLNSDPAPDIEVVHKFHRFSVVSPSIHPVLLTTYVWYGPDGEEMERLPKIEDFASLPEEWLKGLERSKPSVLLHTGSYSGDIDLWMNWLGTEPPWWGAQGIRKDIEAKQHIGHSDLLKLVFRIHATRLEGDNSLRPIFEELVHKFSTTTNNPQWQQELENAVRWTVGNSWSPLDPKNEDK